MVSSSRYGVHLLTKETRRTVDREMASKSELRVVVTVCVVEASTPLASTTVGSCDAFLRPHCKVVSRLLRKSLSDLIALLVICTEAELGMDGTINRVSLEIACSSKILAEKFNLAALEIRPGADRSTALKNLAWRMKRMQRAEAIVATTC